MLFLSKFLPVLAQMMFISITTLKVYIQESNARN